MIKMSGSIFLSLILTILCTKTFALLGIGFLFFSPFARFRYPSLLLFFFFVFILFSRFWFSLQVEYGRYALDCAFWKKNGEILCHILTGIVIGNWLLLNGGSGIAPFPYLFLSFGMGTKHGSIFVNWFAWFVKNRSFGESYWHSQLCIVFLHSVQTPPVPIYFSSVICLDFVLKYKGIWAEICNWSRVHLIPFSAGFTFPGAAIPRPFFPWFFSFLHFTSHFLLFHIQRRDGWIFILPMLGLVFTEKSRLLPQLYRRERCGGLERGRKKASAYFFSPL